MAISIGANIASLQAQRKLGRTTQELESLYERLSSGSRINSAADDAAGLALAESLRAQQRLAQVALRNANDGLSVINIADGGLSEIGNILQRLAELAQQSANGVYSATERSALQLEFSALGSEIERIARATTFNDVSLLSNPQSIELQVGFDSTANSRISITGVSGTLQTIGLAPSGSSVLTFSLVGTSTVAAQSASLLALNAVNAAVSSISLRRGTLGATESRLASAINTLSTYRIEAAAAESRIRDADVAAEAAELTRLTILQQAATAVLAQANQQPQIALQLLGS